MKNTTDREIAVEAVAEGYYILSLLADSESRQWIIDSDPLSELNRLAKELGYSDAYSVCLLNAKEAIGRFVVKTQRNSGEEAT